MSKKFDISTNRIPHGLLTPDERKALEDAANETKEKVNV